MLWSAPARIDGVSDATTGDFPTGRDKNLAGGSAAGGGAIGGGSGAILEVAEAAKLLGDSLDGGFGEGFWGGIGGAEVDFFEAFSRVLGTESGSGSEGWEEWWRLKEWGFRGGGGGGQGDGNRVR